MFIILLIPLLFGNKLIIMVHNLLHQGLSSWSLYEYLFPLELTLCQVIYSSQDQQNRALY